MKKFTLTISKPCQENWAAMTPEEKGRFCTSCQKTVIDFTAMSDRQLAEHFRKTSGSLCGRFHSGQLDREIVVPKKPLPWAKYCFTVTWPAFVLLLKSCGQKNDVMGELFFRPETVQLSTSWQQKTAAPAVIGDTTAVESVITEKIVCSLVKGDVEVVHRENKKQPLTPAILNMHNDEKTTTELSAIDTAIGGATTISALQSERGMFVVGGISVVKSTRVKQKQAATPPVLTTQNEKSDVVVFPNPVRRNESFTVKTAKAFEGTYRLLNVSGQVVVTGRINAGSGQPFSIPAQPLAAGTYFLQMNNEPTGESMGQKIIVH